MLPSCSLLRKDRAVKPVFSEVKEQNIYPEAISQEYLAKQLWQGLCYGIIEDHFSPPVASRILANAFVAQYESLVALEATKTSFCSIYRQKVLQGWIKFRGEAMDLYVDFFTSGRALLYRPKTLDQHRKLLYDHLPQDLPLK